MQTKYKHEVTFRPKAGQFRRVQFDVLAPIGEEIFRSAFFSSFLTNMQLGEVREIADAANVEIFRIADGDASKLYLANRPEGGK